MKLLINCYHFIVGMVWLVVFASSKVIIRKGPKIGYVKKKVEYRLNKMY